MHTPAPTLEGNADKKTEDVKFTWRKDYTIGIEQIDKEHKLIIDHFDKLYELMKDGKGHEYYDELLTFLVSYIDTHLSNEEKYHEEINYPEKKEHLALHRVFTDKIRSIIEAKDEGNVTDGDLININLFIKKWWIHHILVEDMKVANYIHTGD